MPPSKAPPLSRSYAANVALVILTLFPGLVNTTAIALAAPVIGGDLHAAADAAAALPLFSDAALAFGCVLGAELGRRVERRALYVWLLGVSLATSLASALAPDFAILAIAHVVHGLVAGMLFVVILPPLLVTFGAAKLQGTATVMVPALFGAATLGPLVGGAIAEPSAWRAIFAVEVLLAIAAFALARATFARAEPQGADEPVDVPALVLAAVGSALIYAGAGALAGNDWRDPYASGPVAAGVACYVVMLVVEARASRPLVPVRRLATSLALVGTIATVIGSAGFAALTQCFTLTLLRIDALSPRAAGFAFWPEFAAALAGGVVFGRLVTTRWVPVIGAGGLACIGIAASLARALAPLDAAEVGGLSLVAGFGAGLSVAPGLFVVALSFERALVGRAIALLNLFRLTGGFVSAPGVEHTIGSRAARYLARAPGDVHAEATMRAFITGRPLPSGMSHAALQQALGRGIDDAYVIVVVLSLAGVVAIAALVAALHVPLRAPDLRRFDEGKAALDAPALA